MSTTDAFGAFDAHLASLAASAKRVEDAVTSQLAEAKDLEAEAIASANAQVDALNDAYWTRRDADPERYERAERAWDDQHWHG